MPDRLQSVDYMRGIAALAVTWFHLTRSHQDTLLGSTGNYAYLGVAAFFVISGFVIPYAMAASNYRLRHGGRFFLRRLIRLEPPYLAAVALAAVLYAASSLIPGFGGKPWPSAWYDLMLHPAYLVPWLKGHWANPVFWTLAIEFQYYVAMIFLAPAILADAKWINRAVLAATLAVSFASDDSRLLFRYMPLFGFGFIAFLAWRNSLREGELALWSIAMAGACLQVLGLPYAAAGAASCLALLAPWPANLRWLALLGAISYSLYLVHVPIGGRVINLGDRFQQIPFIATLVIATAASLLAALLMWRLVERPSIAMSRQIKTREGTPAQRP